MKKALSIGICMLILFNLCLPIGALAAEPNGVIDSPTQLTAVAGNNQVMLSWSPASDAGSYKVKRSTDNGGPYDTELASGVTTLSYTDTSALNGTRYYYVVTAVSGSSESMISNQASAIPYVPTAGAPAIPEDFAASAYDGSVELAWSPVLNADSYTVRRSTVSEGPYTVVGNQLTTTSFTDTTVTNGEQYYYVVSAANSNGDSADSEELVVEPAAVITVAQDGSGDYSNIGEALATIPATNSARKVIYIKEGTYREKVTVTSPFVSLIGAGRDKTKIVFDDNEETPTITNPSIKLQPLETATLNVGFGDKSANDFHAANLSIVNDSAASKGRALAVLAVSDQVVFENVRIVGYQDTLYAGVNKSTKLGRQYYHNSEIKGRTDFIYGPATAAVFDQVDVVSINSAATGDTGGYVTAGAAKNENGDVPGLVFLNSRLLKDATTKGQHYLGRTWQDQPTVRFINTFMEDHIHPDGWTTMNDPVSAYFLSEYNSSGAGASPSTRKLGIQMTAEEASSLTVPRMMDGWDPTRKIIVPKIFEEVTPFLNPALPDGQLGSYTKPVSVYLEVNNEIPVAGSVQYQLNEGAWTNYTSEFTVSQTGTHVVKYRYVDSTGHAAAYKSVTFVINPAEATKVPAFPGAEGGGMYVTGGRGGDVYIVTKLTDYLDTETDSAVKKGTLRDAISQGNRTIVFETSGNIQLVRALDITQSNLTIAGQTAPGDGIAISGYPVKIGNNDTGTNIIVRYIRFRNGTNELSDVLDITGNNVILDHCSLSWSTDEAFSSKNRKNFTLQWSFITNSLNQSIHTKGPHGYGGIWGGTNASFHHNLISNHVSRNPRFDRATDPDNYPTKIDYRNNVVYNWGFNSAYGGEQATGINMINNYYKAGPNTFDGVKSRIINPSAGDGGGGTYYIDGNFVEGDPEVTANNWVEATSGSYPWKAINPDKGITRKLTPMVIPDASNPFGGPVTTDTAEVAYEKVLRLGGASLPKRDSLDAKIVNDVRNGTGRTVNTIESDGGLPELNSIPAPLDTDRDGIPDAWELANGLNPNDKSDGAVMTSSGYTNLELYINSLVVDPLANPTVTITSPTMHEAITTGNPITISVDAIAGENNGSISKVIFYDSDQQIGEVTSAPYQFTWNNAPEGQHYVYAKAVDNNGVMTLSTPSIIYVNGPENVAPWTAEDIGAVNIPGAASLDGATYRVKGAGKIGNAADSFHYVYQTVEGNFEITAQVDFVSEIDEEAKAGFMVRESLSPDSPATALILRQDPSTEQPKEVRRFSFLNRSTAGKNYTEEMLRDGGYKGPYWLKIVREQNTISSYQSKDNNNWTFVGSTTVGFSDQVYVGMAVDAAKASSNTDYLTAATFTNLKLTRSALFTINNPTTETVDIPAYTVSGDTIDGAYVSISKNGTTVIDAVYSQAGANFTHDIMLDEGENTIVISTKNNENFGNVVNSKTIKVVYNKSAVVFTPVDTIPAATNSSEFILSGSVNRSANVTVTLNGSIIMNNAAQSEEINFTVPMTLKEGLNEIVISGIDQFQNTGSKTYLITYRKNWGEGVFTVQSMTLTDLNGNSVAALGSSKDTLVEVAILNNSLVSQNGVLVIGLFDQQDKLVKYSFLEQTVSPSTTKKIKTILKSPEIVTGYKLKAFVWNNMSGQNLISNVITNP